MSKIFIIVGWIGIILAGLMMLILIYWMLYPYDVTEQNLDPLTISNPNKTITAGNPVLYNVDFCKFRDVSGVAQIQLIDTVVLNYPPITYAGETGCFKRTVGSVVIPESTIDGSYYLQFNVVYQVNPIRTITERYNTERFKVVGQPSHTDLETDIQNLLEEH